MVSLLNIIDFRRLNDTMINIWALDDCFHAHDHTLESPIISNFTSTDSTFLHVLVSKPLIYLLLLMMNPLLWYFSIMITIIIPELYVIKTLTGQDLLLIKDPLRDIVLLLVKILSLERARNKML